MEIVLRDAAHLQEEGGGEQPPPERLLPAPAAAAVFDTEDVERALRLIRSVPFYVQTPVATCGSVVLAAGRPHPRVGVRREVLGLAAPA